MPHNDFGYVDLYDSILNSSTRLYGHNIEDVGTSGSDGWTNVAYNFTTAGNYYIQAGVANVNDNGVPSTLGLDNFQLTAAPPSAAAVPEPGSYGLMGMAIIGIIGFFERRKKREKSFSTLVA